MLSILEKDLISEFRTRFAISSLILFILSSVTLIVFSIAKNKVSESVLSALIWIIIFFSAMSGLSKAFVSEEERGTSFLLKITSNANSIFFGKLIFNTILAFAISILTIFLMLIFSEFLVIRSSLIFYLSMIIGNLSIASSSTIISAIIARANTKGSLFTVLTFPILLPVILLGVEATKMGIEGWEMKFAQDNLVFMFSYYGILTTASYFLFEFIWND